MPSTFLTNMLSVIGLEQKPRVSPYEEAGVSGTPVYGGFVQVIETNQKVAGYNRYKTFSDIMVNTSIVAAGIRYFLGLVTMPTWTVTPAHDMPEKQSSDEAKAAAEFVENVLADMDTSWRRIIKRSGMYRFHGFSIQEWQAKKRDDGLIGVENIETRPQHTIYQWSIEPNSGSVNGVVQRSPQTGELFWIPRWKFVYLVDDTLSDSPEGVGILRQVTEPSERLKEYLRIEGIGYDRDLRGTPMGRAPLAELEQMVKEKIITPAQRDQAVHALQKFVEMQAKDTKTGLLLDSTPFKNLQADGHSFATSLRWGMELLQGNSTGIDHLGAAIERTNWEIARILGVEQLLIGENSGSRALSEDKSKNLYLQVNAVLADMAEMYSRDLIGGLWNLNGFDDRLKPTLVAEDVSFMSVQEVSATLRDMATAGAVLAPNDPVINEVREMMGVSAAPEDLGGVGGDLVDDRPS